MKVTFFDGKLAAMLLCVLALTLFAVPVESVKASMNIEFNASDHVRKYVEMGGRKWIVVDVVDGKPYLMMDSIYKKRQWHTFNDNRNANQIFGFLNDEFDQIITAEEDRDLIAETEWQIRSMEPAKYNTEYDTAGGSDIYPLSITQKLGLPSHKDNSLCSNFQPVLSSTAVWTRTPSYYNTVQIIATRSSGAGCGFDTPNANNSTIGVQPVLYLKDSVRIRGGTGSNTNPYVLSVTSDPTGANIIEANGTTNEVTVQNVPAYITVNVYAADGTTLIGSNKNGSSPGTVTVSVSKDLRWKDKVYVTFTQPGKAESGQVEATVIDVDPPTFDIEVPSTPSNTNVTVTVNVKDASDIVEFNWAMGIRDIHYFRTGSGDDIEGNSFVVTENGNYTVYAKDAAGYDAVESMTITTIDRDPPELSDVYISSSNLNPALAKVGDEIVLTFKASEALSGLPQVTISGQTATIADMGGLEYQATYTMQETDPEGVIKFTIHYRDLAGNVGLGVTSTSDGFEIRFVRTPPAKPTFSADITVPTQSNVKVTIVCPEEEDVSHCEYRTEDDVSWTAYAQPIEMNENGTIYARAVDEAGNVSDIAEYTVDNIDRDPPSAPTLSADITVPTKETVKVTVGCPGDADYCEYRIEDDASWTVYVQPIEMNENGTIYARAVDEAGNVSGIAEYTVDNIDHEPPTVFDVSITSSNDNREWAKVGDVISLTFKASETLAALPVVTIAEQPAAVTSLGSDAYQATYTMQGTEIEDVVAFTIDYTDLAGHDGAQITTTADGSQVKFDRTPPASATLHPDNSGPTNQDVTVTIVYPGDAYLRQYRMSEEEPWQEYKDPVVLSENGTVYARSIDEAGNVSDEATYVVSNIDKDKPIIEPAVFNPDKLTNQNVTVTVAVYDQSSGIVDTRWTIGEQPVEYFDLGGTSFDGSFVVKMNGTYTIYALDEAGNQAVASFTVSHIFREKPDITLTAMPTDPTNSSVSVTVSVYAQHGIEVQKYDFGQHPLEYFATSGETLGSDPIEMKDNGWVSVYVRDYAGNEAVEYLEITNIDRDKPVIQLIGLDRMQIPRGGVFTDPGATAWDEQDGDLSAAIVVSGDVVNSNLSGTYQLEYRVADRAGNEADPVIRTVIVYSPSSNDSKTISPIRTNKPDESDKPDVTDEIEADEEELQPLNLTDIENHWAQEAMQQLSARGIISGYPDGTFRPDNPITRAEFLVMLMRLLGPEEEEAELAFVDREHIGSWAERAIAQALKLGIVQGYGDGSFRAHQQITRTEMSVMIARAIGLSEETVEHTRFEDDEDIPSWAKAAVEAMRKQEIIQGRGNNQFVPNASATRAEAAMIMLRIISIIES
ncbi:S-layer homology domain-containing protein [Ornithinibacillus sp. 4-3]|uniref:S-layer homology domain-containing protein n=1 Tax=Ornithinibacillus sp. 4-3 TaxID=3231488 RepID=A0AB39HMB9_9BACI